VVALWFTGVASDLTRVSVDVCFWMSVMSCMRLDNGVSGGGWLAGFLFLSGSFFFGRSLGFGGNAG
jgi:hypothetical protein